MQINVEKISKVYGEKKALNNISLSINEAGIYLVAGHNGSGKTTLLEILSNVNYPTNGKISSIGNISTLFQENSLRHNARVAEEIAMYQKIFLTPQAYIDELIDQLRLKRYINKKTAELSIGTQRRCLVLLMLMNHEADILLLDEPCSGLDVESRKVIWWVLGRLKSKKIILISDHYLNESSLQAKQVIFLHDGELITHSAIDDFLQEFKYKYITPYFKDIAYVESETEIVINEFGEYLFSKHQLNDNSSEITLEDLYVYINRDTTSNEDYMKGVE
jgi:multidrug/hemolysin transport system ATP-binding protein